MDNLPQSPAPVNEPPPLLTTKDVARLLAVSPRKVWELSNCGELPPIRIGRAVRFDQKDVELFIKRRRKEGR